jgi:hypothetical protein
MVNIYDTLYCTRIHMLGNRHEYVQYYDSIYTFIRSAGPTITCVVACRSRDRIILPGVVSSDSTLSDNGIRHMYKIPLVCSVLCTTENESMIFIGSEGR